TSKLKNPTRPEAEEDWGGRDETGRSPGGTIVTIASKTVEEQYFGSLPRKSAWRRCGVSRHTERIYQDLRVLGDSLDDVPALLFGGGDEGADDRKVGCTGDATEAAGDFLLDLPHPGVPFGLIVGEWPAR